MQQNLAFSEWQYPRISSFLPAILFVPAVWIVGAPFETNVGLLIGAALALVVVFMKLKNSRFIKVDGEFLLLGDAAIPRKIIGKVSAISKEEQFYERGARLDARAFVFLKYGLPEMVKIEIKDKNDPTPYLLVSTRRAKELEDALS
ncbi:MAG: hypothetical protein RLZZ471_35 [Actinomycetota bacterium]|jgi:hypothetical protein